MRSIRSFNAKLYAGLGVVANYLLLDKIWSWYHTTLSEPFMNAGAAPGMDVSAHRMSHVLCNIPPFKSAYYPIMSNLPFKNLLGDRIKTAESPRMVDFIPVKTFKNHVMYASLMAGRALCAWIIFSLMVGPSLTLTPYFMSSFGLATGIACTATLAVLWLIPIAHILVFCDRALSRIEGRYLQIAYARVFQDISAGFSATRLSSAQGSLCTSSHGLLGNLIQSGVTAKQLLNSGFSVKDIKSALQSTRFLTGGSNELVSDLSRWLEQRKTSPRMTSKQLDVTQIVKQNTIPDDNRLPQPSSVTNLTRLVTFSDGCDFVQMLELGIEFSQISQVYSMLDLRVQCVEMVRARAICALNARGAPTGWAINRVKRSRTGSAVMNLNSATISVVDTIMPSQRPITPNLSPQDGSFQSHRIQLSLPNQGDTIHRVFEQVFLREKSLALLRGAVFFGLYNLNELVADGFFCTFDNFFALEQPDDKVVLNLEGFRQKWTNLSVVRRESIRKHLLDHSSDNLDDTVHAVQAFLYPLVGSYNNTSGTPQPIVKLREIGNRFSPAELFHFLDENTLLGRGYGGFISVFDNFKNDVYRWGGFSSAERIVNTNIASRFDLNKFDDANITPPKILASEQLHSDLVSILRSLSPTTTWTTIPKAIIRFAFYLDFLAATNEEVPVWAKGYKLSDYISASIFVKHRIRESIVGDTDAIPVLRAFNYSVSELARAGLPLDSYFPSDTSVLYFSNPSPTIRP